MKSVAQHSPRQLMQRTMLVFLAATLLLWVLVALLPPELRERLAADKTKGIRQQIAETMREAPPPKEEKLVLMPKVVREQAPPKPAEKQPAAPVKPAASIPQQLSASQARTQGAKALKQASMPMLVGALDLPFRTYLRHTQRNSGVLAVFNRQNNRVIGRIEMGRFVRNTQLAGFARRTRDVTEDIPAKLRGAYTDAVENAAGKGVYRFLILLPEQREQQFVGLLSILLSQKGIEMQDTDQVNYRYRLNDGRLTVQVTDVEVKGKRIQINRSSYL
ncbi:MAG: hypothetical protein JAY94_04185 [Candidatus Thiodiazotropha endolucinida]|nr:hypothetical protein [Candidatus Thiodiazotropha taylori]MCW4316690.1 hypothetical protein [Candidatus Thiodiazotropha taylori]